MFEFFKEKPGHFTFVCKQFLKYIPEDIFKVEDKRKFNEAQK